MTPLGTEAQPLRVAIVGSGPAGFYVAEKLQKEEDLSIEIDMYDRLPTPFGLVRFGVAPDHEKIKNVTRVFDKISAKPNFRFFGNVDVGAHVSLAELQQYYHQICFATGAQTDRRMGIPGEDLDRSHAATEFVAWYNSHPDYRDCEFDLSSEVERVAVVGVGNVAVDVARMLCRTREELASTDIADHALEAISGSGIKEVYMLGRRGPVQAAFTNPEVKELGEMPGADIEVLLEEVTLDALSQAKLDEGQDKATLKKLEILQGFAGRDDHGKRKKLTIRFLVSPVELIGDEDGKVVAMRIVKNELYESEDGSLRPGATDRYEELPVQLVFRSVGYHGVPLADLPFDERRGIVPNEKGRVIDCDTDVRVEGVYVSGWIKRGPTGVIGTNKPDAGETVAAMLEDVAAGAVLDPLHPEPSSVEKLIAERRPEYVSLEDWRRINDLEVSRGKDQGRPRVKFTSVGEMLADL